MSRRDSTDAFVEVMVALVIAILVAIVVHYFSRARDYWRLVSDDPQLYALTDGERAWFNVSAWAFLPETALLVGAIAAIALSAVAGLLVGPLVLVGLIALTVSLMSRVESIQEQYEHDDFYDLSEVADTETEN
jgi:hypothetical protein